MEIRLSWSELAQAAGGRHISDVQGRSKPCLLQVMSMAVGDILMHVPEELEGPAEDTTAGHTGREKRSLSPPLCSTPESPSTHSPPVSWGIMTELRLL